MASLRQLRKQLLSLLLLMSAVSLASAAFESDVWPEQGRQLPWLKGSPNFAGFDWDRQLPPQPSLTSSKATFASVFQSSKSDSKRSRSEETKQEVLTHSQSSEWARGFQDNGQGGQTRLDSSSSQESTAGRSAKELKASESGESAHREQKLTRVNGETVVNTDAGKQSSFSNSGHLANRTEFSSETSSSDNRLAKVVLPPPPPALTACIVRSRVSLVFLVHASADAGALARLLGFLDAFLTRLTPARALVVFFNRRVLEVVDSADQPPEALPRRLAEAARGLREALADECDLPAAAADADRLRRQLRLPSPCLLFVLAAGGVHADERALAEARPAAEQARRSFDQLTPVVPLGLELEPRAADMLRLFATGQRPGLLALAFGGGGRVDAESADILGVRVCEAAAGVREAGGGHGAKEPSGRRRHDEHERGGDDRRGWPPGGH